MNDATPLRPQYVATCEAGETLVEARVDVHTLTIERPRRLSDRDACVVAADRVAEFVGELVRIDYGVQGDSPGAWIFQYRPSAR